MARLRRRRKPVSNKDASPLLGTIMTPVLTFLGVLISGALTLTAADNKDNSAPNVEFKAFVGKAALSGVGDGPVQSIGVAPAGSQIVLLADKTFDPDGDNTKLKMNWAVLPRGPAKTCAGEASSCGAFEWTPEDEGFYLVTLRVADDADCTWWRTQVFGGNGCSKTAYASLSVRVLPDAQPKIVLQPFEAHVAWNRKLTLDGSKSYSFDGSPLTMIWTVDGIRNTVGDSLVVGPGSSDGMKIELVAFDRFGRTSTTAIDVKVEENDAAGAFAAPATAEAEPKGSQNGPNTEEERVCNGGASLALSKPLTIESPGLDCELPRQVITNGFEFRLAVRNLRASDARIQAFANDAPAASGSHDIGPAPPAPDGRSPGERGMDGDPGGEGLNGDDGRPGGGIALAAASLEGSLFIDSSGENGEYGGKGGQGGRGGNGAQGSAASSGFLDCRRGPGRGGDGGQGGPGGNGGRAGSGGAAGNISIDIARAVPGAILYRLDGGSPGLPGNGGLGGEGGRGGREGPTNGFCRTAGRSGSDGAAGVSGSSGGSGSAGSVGSKVERLGYLGLPVASSHASDP